MATFKHSTFKNPSGRFTYNYAIFDPSNGTKKLPALIFIPGNGEVGTNVNELYANGSPLEQVRSGRITPDFMVIGFQPTAIWPNALTMQWAIDYFLSTYNIDQDNYFLTGLSGGAQGIFVYVRDTPDAAFKSPRGVIPMSITVDAQCGDYYKKTDRLCGTDLRFKNIAVWAMCGDGDSHFPKMQRYIQRMLEAGYDAKWTTYKGGHGGWAEHYNPSFKENGQNIYDWMKSKINAPTPEPTPTPEPEPEPEEPPTPSKKLIATIKVYDDGSIEKA